MYINSNTTKNNFHVLKYISFIIFLPKTIQIINHTTKYGLFEEKSISK